MSGLDVGGGSFGGRPPRRRDHGWLKWLLAALLLFLAVIMIVMGFRLVKSGVSHAIDFAALRKNGQMTVTEFDEKLLIIYPFLPDSYEDDSEGEITITNVDDKSRSYLGAHIEHEGRTTVCYVLEEGTYSIEIQWPNGVTGSAVLHVGDQSLYELGFTHL